MFWWFIVLFLLLLPWLAVLGTGGYWLWLHRDLWLHGELWQGQEWWWAALGLFVSSYGTAWIIAQQLRRKGRTPFPRRGAPPVDAADSRTVEAARARLRDFTAQLDPKEYPPTDAAKLAELSRRIIGQVARDFRPKAEHPELDVSIPYALLIVERVSHDMRRRLAENVPFSHLLTIDTGLRLARWKEKLEALGVYGRVFRMLINPAEGVARELGGAVFGKVMSYPLDELETWFLRTLAEEIGEYAIQLYSGRLVLDEGVENFVTDDSREAAAQAEDAATRLRREPLRLAVVGQVKAGKSSLINALFGDLRAASDALPCTDALAPYCLRQDGLEEALIFDSPGYGEDAAWLDRHWEELCEMDLLLLLCSATQAGREADARFLRQWITRFDAHPERRCPPLLVIVTHIDLLRPFREWNPPYDLRDASREKARGIRDAVEDVAQTLGVPVERVLPVCLKSNEEYNIDAVWASIAGLLPESQRVRYLRVLRHAKDRENWSLTLTQLANGGRWLAKQTQKLLP